MSGELLKFLSKNPIASNLLNQISNKSSNSVPPISSGLTILIGVLLCILFISCMFAIGFIGNAVNNLPHSTTNYSYGVWGIFIILLVISSLLSIGAYFYYELTQQSNNKTELESCKNNNKTELESCKNENKGLLKSINIKETECDIKTNARANFVLNDATKTINNLEFDNKFLNTQNDFYKKQIKDLTQKL